MHKLIKFISKHLYSLLCFLLLMATNCAASNFRSGSLSYLYGDNFKVEPEQQQTLTFEYVAAWNWGDMFLFIDHKTYDEGGSGRYGEFSPRIKLAEFGADGIIKQVLIASTFERGKNGVASNLYGIGVDFNTKAMRYLNVNLYQRNDPDIAGKGMQITTVWAFDADLSDVPILIDGFFDWTFNSDEHHDNFHFNPQIKIDMKKWQGGHHQWYLGIEYDYWRNKFGIKDSPILSANQNTFSLLAKWHF